MTTKEYTETELGQLWRDTHDILVEARRLIAEGWTQGAMARDDTGRGLHAAAEAATCWCATGAIARAACNLFAVEHEQGDPAYAATLNRRQEAIRNGIGHLSATVGAQIIRWNDGADKFSTIVAGFDQAIFAARYQAGE